MDYKNIYEDYEDYEDYENYENYEDYENYDDPIENYFLNFDFDKYYKMSMMELKECVINAQKWAHYCNETDCMAAASQWEIASIEAGIIRGIYIKRKRLRILSVLVLCITIIGCCIIFLKNSNFVK